MAPSTGALSKFRSGLAQMLGCLILTAMIVAPRLAIAATINYLPNIPVENQSGDQLSLASLKGKLIVVAFIHTSCGGVCQLTTAKMKRIADAMGTSFGTKITMLSVTTDPTEDHPAQLGKYAKAQGATARGWVFLTGKPEQIEQILALYGLPTDPDAAMEHVDELRLLDTHGYELKHYQGNVRAATVIADLKGALSHERL